MSTGGGNGGARACDVCLARTALLGRLAGHIDRHRDRVPALLGLADDELLRALAGKRRPEVQRDLEAFVPDGARTQAQRAGLEPVCRCDPAYPEALRELPAPPAVLHVVGGVARLGRLLERTAVAVVGARRPSPYGSEVARWLGRGLGAAGLTVLSGMARGIDTCAHRGALDAGAATVAVLAGAAERPYPARARALHAQIMRTGAVVSELPPGTLARRWMFPARNRIIAGLSAMTVVVEARLESGALITAHHSRALGRGVAAVPGRVNSPLARGPHQLLREGAQLVQEPHDVLEQLFGSEVPRARSPRPPLEPRHQVVLDALAEGHDADAALARAGLDAQDGLAALAALELAGVIVRGPGGGYRAKP